MKWSIVWFAFMLCSCSPPAKPDPGHETPKTSNQERDSLVNGYLKARPNYLYDPQGWQDCIDSAIAVDPYNAYLWQQKSMPLFKARKYSLGMQHLSKAVALDRDGYLDYRAFIKCIFLKDYEDALADLKELIAKDDDGIVQDHSYHFYAALCQLQLNQFFEAKASLQKSIENQLAYGGSEWVHFMDYFYLGIALYELGEFEEAIAAFNETLKTYPQLSDAHFYKSYAYSKVQNTDSAKVSMKKTTNFIKQGYSINESNAIYEMYPYQINREWFR